MPANKPKRIYHRGWDKRGDIIAINGKWVTARLDGGKGAGCWSQRDTIRIMLSSRNRMMRIEYLNRYRQRRDFYEKNGYWYFDVKNDQHVRFSMNHDGSLYHVDPSGGPFISIDTNLQDVHEDLPDATPKSIEFDKDEGAYKLTV